MGWWSSYFQLESKNKRNKYLRENTEDLTSIEAKRAEVNERNARETRTRLQHHHQEQAHRIRLEEESRQERMRLDEERRNNEEQRSRHED